MTSLLPLAKQTVVDVNGRPVAGGKVYFYIPGTETPKNTYQDQAETIPNTNPVILDGNGQCVVWGDGVYRQVVYNAAGVLLWDQTTKEGGAPSSSAQLQASFGASDQTGTGVIVFNNSPKLITPTISGITNATPPAAGNVGEIIAKANSAGVSSATLSNLVSMTITPGIWLLFGSATFQNGSSPITGLAVGLSTVSSAAAGIDRTTYAQGLNGNTQGAPAPLLPVSVSAITTVYLVGSANFSGGTTIASANMSALRIA